MKSLLVCAIGLVATSILCNADSVIGNPPNGGNFFPFGGAGGGSSTIYQQVYAASDFSGPITIHDIGFFNTVVPGGHIAGATYTFHLSTTSVAVNSLDTVNFDNNLGADNTLFDVAVLGSTPVSGEFDFTGTTNFNYDPSRGNLLLDIRVSNRTETGGGSIFFDARNGNAGGLFSRAQNFGVQNADYGLVTKFSTAVPEPTSLALLGTVGAAIAFGFRRKLR